MKRFPYHDPMFNKDPYEKAVKRNLVIIVVLLVANIITWFLGLMIFFEF